MQKPTQYPHQSGTLSDSQLRMCGYGLTLAKFFYGLPDHKLVLQEFSWQEYDLYPDYPVLTTFIKFWQTKLDGPLHSVAFTHAKPLSSGNWRNVVSEYKFH